MTKEANKLIITLFLMFLLFVCLMLSWNFVNGQSTFDENGVLDIIFYGPKPKSVVYPNFSKLFYSFFIWIGGLISWEIDGRIVARFVNSCLLPINGLLYFFVLRRFFPIIWCFLGVLLFCLSPGVFLSSVIVKTESLLLFELLFCTLAAYKYIDCNPNKEFLWSALLGFLTFLPFVTKFNPIFPAIYLGALLLKGKGIKGAWDNQRKNIFIYTSIFILSFLIFLPWNYEILKNIIIERNSKDLYFLDMPNPSRAVEGFFSFPYGRFVFPIISVIPICLGVINYLGLLGNIFLRKNFKDPLLLFGPFLLLYFIFSCTITLTRYPWMFTPMIPFLLVFSLHFWKNLIEGISKNRIKIGITFLIIVMIQYQLIQFKDLSIGFFNFVDPPLPPRIRKILNTKDVVTFKFNSEENYKKWDAILLNKNVKYILFYDQLLKNICEYKKDPDYIRICFELTSLVEEKRGFKIIWKKTISKTRFTSDLGFDFDTKIFFLERVTN